MIILLTWPSWVGKWTIWKTYLKNEWDKKIEKVITCTTRQQREGEKEWIDYYFLNKPEFESKIQKWEMIEYANVYGNLYGSSYDELQRIMNKWKIVLYEIDPQWVKTLQNFLSEKYLTKSIFVLPPDIEELKKRLLKRDSENDRDFDIRINQASSQIDEKDIYDFNLINDDLEKVVFDFSEIIENFGNI